MIRTQSQEDSLVSGDSFQDRELDFDRFTGPVPRPSRVSTNKASCERKYSDPYPHQLFQNYTVRKINWINSPPNNSPEVICFLVVVTLIPWVTNYSFILNEILLAICNFACQNGGQI